MEGRGGIPSVSNSKDFEGAKGTKNLPVVTEVNLFDTLNTHLDLTRHVFFGA